MHYRLQQSDNVKHEKLLDILQYHNLAYHDIQIISNLYCGQSARVKYDGMLIEEICIWKGFGQGCTLSLILFNIYLEYTFQKALEDESSAGIIINSGPINNIRYTNIFLIAISLEDL